MKIWKTVFIGVLAIIVFSGCTVRSLSVLQTEFNATVRVKATCEKEPSKTEQSRTEDCLQDFDAIFSDIANQSEKALNQYTGEQGVKIALHRLYTYALWQSGASEQKVVVAAKKGQEACAAGKPETAPRDCVLLDVVGRFKAIETRAAKVSLEKRQLFKLEKAAAVEKCKNTAKQWQKELDGYMRDTYTPFRTKVDEIANNKNRSKSVLAYLEHQLKMSQEPLLDMGNLVTACVPDQPTVAEILKCPCKKGACENFDEKENPHYKLYWKVHCLKKTIYQSQTCPCNYAVLKKKGRFDTLDDDTKVACDYLDANTQSQTRELFDSKCLVEQALK